MNVSGKYKGLVFLISLLVVLPLAAWSFALKGTVHKWREYKKDGKEIAELRVVSASAQPKDEETVLTANVELIASGQLISAISECADENRIVIDKYTPYIMSNSDGFEIITGEIIVSGGYIPLIRLIHYIEQELNDCKLISANFRGVTERRTGKKNLSATLLIQQIVKQN